MKKIKMSKSFKKNRSLDKSIRKILMGDKINYLKIIVFIIYLGFFSFLFLGMPNKVCLVNGMVLNCSYGKWASYMTFGLITTAMFFAKEFLKKEDA